MARRAPQQHNSACSRFLGVYQLFLAGLQLSFALLDPNAGNAIIYCFGSVVVFSSVARNVFFAGVFDAYDEEDSNCLQRVYHRLRTLYLKIMGFEGDYYLGNSLRFFFFFF